MEEKTKLENWLSIYSEKRNYEDLFFILLETIETGQKDSITTYKKLKNSLVLSLDNCTYYSSNMYGQNYWNKSKKENILSCLDLVLEINGPKILTSNTDLSSIEKNGGSSILEKHNVNLNQKNYLNFKLNLFCNNKSSEFKTNMPTQIWLDNFIAELHQVSKNADVNIVYNKVNQNLIMFCAAIELGFEPSKKEILTRFKSVWENLNFYRINELSYFCEFFAKTNVFKNSLAPAKNIELLLKGFFKDFLTNCDASQPFSSQPLALHEDKIQLLFNHPAFLHENIQKQILRKNAQKFLGKTLLKEEEIELVQNFANKEKTQSRKIKI